MLKLILHHTYKLGGEAVDLSRHHNHGFRHDVGFAPHGREPDSGALRFESDTSRVHVPFRPVWSALSALRVEAWVKLTGLGHRQTIAVGQGAFSFAIRADGVLEGSFVPPSMGGPPPPSLLVNSDTGSPDRVTRTVPVGQWTCLTYLHDGINALRLYIDGTLVAGAYRVGHPVRSVGPGGVQVGHGLADHGSTLAGRLDELRIWKHDPESGSKQFNGRPTDQRQRDCWRSYMEHLRGVLADPKKRQQFDSWLGCIIVVLVDMLRDIRGRGEEVIRQQDELSRQYLALWTHGDLSGPKMEAWMGAWVDWVRATLGPPVFAGYLDRIRGCFMQHPGLDPFELAGDLADCDPAFAGYLRLMGEVLHDRDPSLGWARGWLDRRKDPGGLKPPVLTRRPDPSQWRPRQGGEPDGPGQGPYPCGC